MDLLTLIRTAWRHRWAALPALALTLLGVVYLAAYSPKVYTLTVSQLLLAPPPPPDTVTTGRPAPGTSNPLTRLPSQSIVGDLVSRRVMTDHVHKELTAAGATGEYEVVPSVRYGTASPILDVNVEGTSASSTTTTARIVADRVQTELRAMQAELDVADPYMFTALEVATLDPPRMKTTALLRSLIAVLVAGALLALAAISLAQGLQTSRRDRARVRLVAQRRGLASEVGPDRAVDDRAAGRDRTRLRSGGT